MGVHQNHTLKRGGKSGRTATSIPKYHPQPQITQTNSVFTDNQKKGTTNSTVPKKCTNNTSWWWGGGGFDEFRCCSRSVRTKPDRNLHPEDPLYHHVWLICFHPFGCHSVCRSLPLVHSLWTGEHSSAHKIRIVWDTGCIGCSLNAVSRTGGRVVGRCLMQGHTPPAETQP